MPEKGSVYRRFHESMMEDPLSSVPVDCLIELERLAKDEIHEICDRTNQRIDEILENDPEIRASLSALIDELVNKVAAILENVNNVSIEQQLRTLGVRFEKVKATILRPDETDVPERQNGESSADKILLTSKLKLLLEALREIEVYTDQIHVITGEKAMSRKDTYACVHVLPYGKSVLLNVHYGEATFVTPWILTNEEIGRMGKEDLIERRAIWIPFYEDRPEEWKRIMLDALQVEGAERMTLRDVFQAEFRRRYPEPKDFLELTFAQKSQVKIFGRGLFAVASMFETGGNPVGYSRDTARLAQAIYLDKQDDPAIMDIINRPEQEDPLSELDIEAQKERILEEFRRLYPEPKDFLNLTNKQKLQVKIFGRGLFAIASMFETGGNPAGYSRDAARLAQAIYQDKQDDPTIMDILNRPKKPKKEDPLSELDIEAQKEQILEEFRRLYPEPKDFLKLTKMQKEQVKIFGRGLIAIASMFGTGGNPIKNSRDAARLAQAIYPDKQNDPAIMDILNRPKKEDPLSELDIEAQKKRIMEEFRRLYPEPENFLKLTNKQKKQVKIFGRGLIAVALIFGTGGNPANWSRDAARLAQAIYGIKI